MTKSKAKRKKKTGPPTLVPGERTERYTTNLPESTAEMAVERAGEKGMSAYLRSLVERDLGRKAS